MTTTTDDHRDELTGWRLYFLHRGRLCSPMMRELQPLAPIEDAMCLNDDHEPPAVDCWCGWRIADNVEALRPAAHAMCTPAGMPPVLARLREDVPERADNQWAVPEHILERYDWPAPALVRVRGFGGVRRAEDVLDLEDDLVKFYEGSRYNLVKEGRGMWRAARAQIVGPIIIGQSPRPVQWLTQEVVLDAADHYRVPVFVAEQTFPVIFEQVAAGWLPPALNRAARRAMQRPQRKQRTHA